MKLKLLKLIRMFHLIDKEKYNEKRQIEIVKKSPLFNKKWYLSQNPDVKAKKMGAAKHYVKYGWKKGRNPSPEFDTNVYLQEFPELRVKNWCPLFHYMIQYKKNDIKIFTKDGIFCLLKKCTKIYQKKISDYEILKKSKLWDKKYYLKNNSDIKIAKVDPVEHYLYTGYLEGRIPSAKFEKYQFITPDNVNPVVYIEKHKSEYFGLDNMVNSHYKQYVEHAQNVFIKKSNFVDKINFSTHDFNFTKLIAFYLPQYHMFKENEEWHGKGFTEWTNVTKAQPQFVGHIQPQLPIDVGFYDLSNIEVMKRQVELAKLYGIYGFCFHYYWFSGKKLMEKPIYNWLEHSEIEFPFCLCWANENWSKLWDGGNKEVLMRQELLDGDDEKFADDIIPFFKDKRYIRIDNKPLFIVYRPALFEQKRFNKFVKILKEKCKGSGIDDLYIMVSTSFGFNEDPVAWGADAVVEFPPNVPFKYNYMNKNFVYKNSKLSIIDAADFILNKRYLYDTNYVLYKTVFPSWDNTARKAYTGATCFYGETPKLYKQWLSDCISWTKENHKNSEQFVFVNAWNEWAEGAHLEPDNYYGYAYLDATRKVLESHSGNRNKIIYIGHDANYNGAQLLTLNILKSMREKYGYNIECILLGDGELVQEYQKYCNVTIIDISDIKAVSYLIQDLKYRGYNKAITNTIITGQITGYLKQYDIATVSLIHELPKIIHYYNAETAGESIAVNSDKIIFASSYVRDAFNSLFKSDKSKLEIIPQGLYRKNSFKNNIKEARMNLRKELGLPTNAKIALFVGMGDRRKGTDLYFDVADKIIAKNKNIYFVLVGSIEPSILVEKQEIINKHTNNIILCGKKTDVGKYYAGADIFLLTSREDPFPSVVLEAFECGIPVVGFKEAGGFVDIVNNNTGRLVKYEDINAMVKAIIEILYDKNILATISKNTRKLITEKFDWDTYVGKLLDLSDSIVKKVSVIVPNYNYAKYIEQRLNSIVSQTYPIYELIVLDDCSSDNSLEVIKKFKQEHNINMRIVPNKTNSGNVFHQWAKGIEIATGDYIWIAEADDLSDSTFLAHVMNKFNDTEVVLGYAQSKVIDENNKITSDNYLFYTNDISETKWKSDYIINGMDEIKTALCVKNTIPNVSACVFKKFDIKPYLKEITTYKVGGDLYLYLQLLKDGKIAFCSKSLNMHRRHSGSVTVSKENNKKHFNEIVQLQNLAVSISEPDQKTRTIIQNYRKHIKHYLLGE